ncbi:MAG: hypothetical protein FWG78_00015 [Coriobacteriia bacterium]|nr:hypothetical protein [Coriobacteriia bacterium]
MRVLTLRGFLKRYLTELSDSPDLRMTNLVDDLLAGNGRLKEPLFVYAKLTAQGGRLRALLADSVFAGEYEQFERRYEAHDGDVALLGPRYAKLMASYVSVRDRSAEKHLKSVMREKVLKGLHAGQMSKYQMAKELGLNQGNMFAFLGKGELGAMSVSNARAMVALLDHATSFGVPATSGEER